MFLVYLNNSSAYLHATKVAVYQILFFLCRVSAVNASALQMTYEFTLQIYARIRAFLFKKSTWNGASTDGLMDGRTNRSTV